MAIAGAGAQVIVGGGLLGSAVARSIARTAPTGLSTLLLDSNPPSTCATARSAGMVIQVTNSVNKSKMVRRTLQDISALADELDDGVGFTKTGTLRIALSEGNKSRLREDEEKSTQAGVDSRWISTEEASAMAPFLNLPSTAKVLFTPEDGYVDPCILASSYLTSARNSGLETKFNTSVQSLELASDDSVAAVVASDGQRYETSSVVDCGGLWAGLLGHQSAAKFEPLSMAPTRSHYWIATTSNAADASTFPRNHPNVILPDLQIYTRPSPSGIILGVQENSSLTLDPTTLAITPETHTILDAIENEVLSELLGAKYAEISEFIPALETLELHNYVSGLSSYTIDGNYIIGPQGGAPNLYVCSGCNGSGVAAAGGIAAVVGKGLMVGEFPSEYVPTRFEALGAGVFSESFRRKCAEARSSKFQSSSSSN